MSTTLHVRALSSDADDFNIIDVNVLMVALFYEMAVNHPGQRKIVAGLGEKIAEALRRIDMSLPGARRFVAQHGATFARCGERYEDTAIHAVSAHHAVIEYVEVLRSRLQGLATRVAVQRDGKLPAAQAAIKEITSPDAERLAERVAQEWPAMVRAIRPTDVQTVTNHEQLQVALEREQLLTDETTGRPTGRSVGAEATPRTPVAAADDAGQRLPPEVEPAGPTASGRTPGGSPETQPSAPDRHRDFELVTVGDMTFGIFIGKDAEGLLVNGKPYPMETNQFWKVFKMMWPAVAGQECDTGPMRKEIGGKALKAGVSWPKSQSSGIRKLLESCPAFPFRTNTEGKMIRWTQVSSRLAGK